MHEIAERAEFSIGTLYKFFKNKEDLYSALLVDRAEQFSRVLDEVFAKEDDVQDIIRDFITAKATFFKHNRALIRLYFAETQGASFNFKTGLDQELLTIHNKMTKKLASVLEKGIRSKVLRKIDPYYLSVALEGLTNSFLFCGLEDPDSRPHEVKAPLIAELFLKGCLLSGEVV